MFTFPVIRINLRFWINHTVSEIHISGGHETYGIVEKIMLFRARKVATIFIEVCKWYDRICVTHLSLYPGSGAILEHTCIASPRPSLFFCFTRTHNAAGGWYHTRLFENPSHPRVKRWVSYTNTIIPLTYFNKNRGHLPFPKQHNKLSLQFHTIHVHLRCLF